MCRATPAFLAAAIAGGPLFPAHADPPAIRVRWPGHAAFEVVSPGGTRLLIDPWLLENPATPARYKDPTFWSRPDARPSAILATHPHPDQGDVEIHAVPAWRGINSRQRVLGHRFQETRCPFQHPPPLRDTTATTPGFAP